jgi:tetratricopeptide (TPR) repeat protein
MNRIDGDPRRIRLLEQAVAKDPKFAVAYADLASERWLAGQPLADIERDARRAVELDPMLGAQSMLGAVEAAGRNWLAAAHYFEEAIAIDPRLRESPVIPLLMPTGKVGASVELELKFLEENPNSSGVAYALSRFYNTQGRNEEAIRHADMAEKLGLRPNANRQLNTRADVAARKGQYTEAAKYMLRGLSTPARSEGGMEAVSLVYAAMGEPAKRPAAIDALKTLLGKVGSREDPGIRIWALSWFVQLGALDQAYDVGNGLQHEYEAQTPAGAWGWLWNREMSPFRRDPRFQEFVTRLGMMPYWEKYGPPDDCDLKDGRLNCR